MDKEYKAWDALFQAILEENGYYNNIRGWLKLHKTTPKDEAVVFHDSYSDAEQCSPYEWLDMIENYLEDVSLKKRKALNNVYDLVRAAICGDDDEDDEEDEEDEED